MPRPNYRPPARVRFHAPPHPKIPAAAPALRDSPQRVFRPAGPPAKITHGRPAPVLLGHPTEGEGSPQKSPAWGGAKEGQQGRQPDASFAPVGKPTDTTASRAVGFSVVFWHFQLPGVPMELFGDDWSFAIAYTGLTGSVLQPSGRDLARTLPAYLPAALAGFFAHRRLHTAQETSHEKAPPKRG